MDAVKEIARRDNRIKNDSRLIKDLKEEIQALRQLLDCAAANIAILVGESGGKRKISRSDVSEALGKYHLSATCDDEGNYILEAVKTQKQMVSCE